ncbi:MAG: hypothetical protein QOI91_2094 [Solirubrobacteraceae bacterium]|nr:hypothetical protein [Solirubrobacteraceae bacterium]
MHGDDDTGHIKDLQDLNDSLVGEIRSGNAAVVVEMQALKAEMHDFRAEMNAFRADMHAFRTSIIEDTRDFTRALIGRFDRYVREMTTELRRLSEETRELREESRAQTQALLAVLDRLDRPQPGGAAA